MNKYRSKETNGSFIKSCIIILTVIIPVITIAMAVLGVTGRLSLQYFIPVTIIIIIVTAIQLNLLFRVFKGISIIDQNAVILSQGNLNISDIIIEKTNGLEMLASAFNDMKRNLLGYIESTKVNVIVLSEAIDKVTKSIDMSYKGNEQIASSMAAVAEKAQEQLNITKSTLEGIEKVNQGAGKITVTLENIEGFVENTVNLASDNTAHLNEYNEQMQVISINLKDTSDYSKTLNLYLSEINQFGNLIMDITGQLKLLSLNSQVEAARAGEAGKGFSVVADEMNKLSIATKNSMVQINKLLDNIEQSNIKVSESILKITESFSMSNEIFNSVKESFDSINTSANILNTDIKEVYEESLMISGNTKAISQKGTNLYNAAHEISYITQDVAAVTEEELAENEEINTQAVSLKSMLENIEKQLKRYKTSVLPVDLGSSKKLKFVMVTPTDSQFWQSIRKGALYAQTELKDKNAEIEFLSFTRADTNVIKNLNHRIEEGCDGLILPGFIKGIEKCVEKANHKNIPVIAINCDFPGGVKRLSFFGTDISSSAALAGKLLARSIDETGDVIILNREPRFNINVVRRNAIAKELSKYKNIKNMIEVNDIADSSQLYDKLKEIQSNLPELKAIIIINGGISEAAKMVEDKKLIGKIKLFCFNHDTEIIELIKKGIVHKAIGQDPFGQGHDPVIFLYNYLVAREVPEDITYTRTEVLDKNSVGN